MIVDLRLQNFIQFGLKRDAFDNALLTISYKLILKLSGVNVGLVDL